MLNRMWNVFSIVCFCLFIDIAVPANQACGLHDIPAEKWATTKKILFCSCLAWRIQWAGLCGRARNSVVISKQEGGWARERGRGREPVWQCRGEEQQLKYAEKEPQNIQHQAPLDYELVNWLMRNRVVQREHNRTEHTKTQESRFVEMSYIHFTYFFRLHLAWNFFSWSVLFLLIAGKFTFCHGKWSKNDTPSWWHCLGGGRLNDARPSYSFGYTLAQCATLRAHRRTRWMERECKQL